jgi:hypothetical protein
MTDTAKATHGPVTVVGEHVDVLVAAAEYDALKAVEAVARRLEWQAYIPNDYHGAGVVCHACGGYSALGHKPDCELAEGLAALDAIRKPSNGKTGEAKL